MLIRKDNVVDTNQISDLTLLPDHCIRCTRSRVWACTTVVVHTTTIIIGGGEGGGKNQILLWWARIDTRHARQSIRMEENSILTKIKL